MRTTGIAASSLALVAALSLLGTRAVAGDTSREARVSLDVRDTDVHDLVAALLQVSGLQSIFDPGISCRLTLKVHELSWLKALQATLNACALGYEEEGTVVRIATRERLRSEAAEERRLAELKQETRSNRVALVRLSYGRAREMAPLLKKVLSSRAEVTYDDRTNTLIIID
jgi:type IV pilus assembly protein PilQ